MVVTTTSPPVMVFVSKFDVGPLRCKREFISRVQAEVDPRRRVSFLGTNVLRRGVELDYARSCCIED